MGSSLRAEISDRISVGFDDKWRSLGFLFYFSAWSIHFASLLFCNCEFFIEFLRVAELIFGVV